MSDSDEVKKFNAAWAAVIGGVEWNPGDHDSIGGVTKDEALEYAADFLRAYRDSHPPPFSVPDGLCLCRFGSTCDVCS